MSHPLRRRSSGRSRRFALACFLVPLSAFALVSLLAAFFLPEQPGPGGAGTLAEEPTQTATPALPAATSTLPPASGATPAALSHTPTSAAAAETGQPPAGPQATPTPRASVERVEQQGTEQPPPNPTPTSTTTPAPPTGTPAPTPKPKPGIPYFGVALQQVDAAHGLAQAALTGVGVTRVSELNWDYVEPVRTEPPTYLWDKMAGLDQELANAAQSGIQVTLLVMYTPLWARQVTNRACSPIRDDALDEYAQFVQEAVKRYSQPPFGIHDWEFYNEPDVDPSLVPAYSGIGCWGDAADPFYGGRAFGRMLMAAYPAVKKADPTARVIVGGLLLDRPDTPPAAFTAGLLEAGAGDSFDFLAFHAYAFFYSPTIPESDRLPDMPWSSRGGVVAGKAQFLRDVMSQYGVSKPLILNEAGLGWYGSKPPPEEFPAFQGDYVAKLYTRGRALDLASVIWYGWEAPGWRHLALLNADLSPRPGAAALAVAIDQLGQAEYTGAAGYDGIEGYTFLRSSDRLQVLWPADALPHEVRIPLRDLRSVFDSVGRPVGYASQSGQAVLAVERPLYLVMAP